MATTLEELLGISRPTQNTENSYDRFPSFDEYQRNRGYSNNGSQSSYAPERPAIDNSVSAYQYNLNDVRASQREDYQPVQYNQYGQTSEQLRLYQQQNAYTIPAPTQRYSNPERAEKKENEFYQYTIRDLSPNAEAIYDSQLGHTSRVSDGEAVVEKQSIFTSIKSENKKEGSKRAKLNTKGKILFAVYFAVVILVAVLIIVNAGDLNRGTATTPSSSVSGVVGDAQESHILADYEIDCEYGTTFNIK